VNWDLVAFDEYHFGAWRETAKELFEGEDETVAKKEAKLEYAAGLEDVNEDLTVLSGEGSRIPPHHDQGIFSIFSGTPFKGAGHRRVHRRTNLQLDLHGRTARQGRFRRRREQQQVGNPYGALPQMRLLTYQMPERTADGRGAPESSTSSTSMSSLQLWAQERARSSSTEPTYKKWLDIIRGQYAPKIVEGLKSEKPPFPYSDVRLLPYLQHSFWFLPNVAACHAMANLLAQKHNVFWHEFKCVVAAGAVGGDRT